MLYKYPVYSTKYKNLPFKIIGYDYIADKIILMVDGKIKEYKQFYDRYNTYFCYGKTKYYLSSFRFQMA